jgi:hypothetical protein
MDSGEDHRGGTYGAGLVMQANGCANTGMAPHPGHVCLTDNGENRDL